MTTGLDVEASASLALQVGRLTTALETSLAAQQRAQHSVMSLPIKPHSQTVVGGGLLIATATVPTFQFSLWRTMAQPAAWAASGSAVLVGQTAILAAPAVTTGCWFDMEWNIGLRTPGVVASAGTSASSTVTCIGKVSITEVAILSTAGDDLVGTIPAAGATYSPTDTTWPQDQQVYLWPTLSLGAATAGNTVTMEWLKLYGEN